MTRNTGRLDDVWNNVPAAIEDLEFAAHVLTVNDDRHDWTLHELDRVRRLIKLLDAVGARVERGLERGPYPTGTGVSGA